MVDGNVLPLKPTNWYSSKFNNIGWKIGQDQANWEKLMPEKKGSIPIWDDPYDIDQPVERLPGEDEYIWQQVVVPVGATQVNFTNSLEGAALFIDGASVYQLSENHDLKNNKYLLLRHSKDNPGLKEPLQFKCSSQSLVSLKEWRDFGLSRYSGFLDYNYILNLKEADFNHAILDLGKVKHMAEVWVNNRHVGEKMWGTFKFKVSEFLHPGENRIKVRIGNLIVNKVALQEDFGYWTQRWGLKGYPAKNCFEAGLLGPVKINVE